MPLTFSDFSPANFVFEVRYRDAYLLWDHAGHVLEELRSRHEITRRIAGEPTRISFVVDATKEVTWLMDRLSIIEHQPEKSKTDAFGRFCADCLDLTVENMGVGELNRVGYRSIFVKKFSRKEDAGAALLSAGLIRIPKGKNFNIEPTNTYPEYAIKCEDEKFGYVLRLSVQEVNYELEMSPQWKGNALERKHEDHVALDIDYYSRGVLAVGSFKVEEWLGQVAHAIRRDADSYLVG